MAGPRFNVGKYYRFEPVPEYRRPQPERSPDLSAYQYKYLGPYQRVHPRLTTPMYYQHFMRSDGNDFYLLPNSDENAIILRSFRPAGGSRLPRHRGVTKKFSRPSHPKGCTRLTLKKYTKRPSPPYHANECKGATKKGNDGRKYISVADARGVYTWKPNITRKRTMRSYAIHNNGLRPYVVDVDKANKKVNIFKQTYDEETEKYTIDKQIGTYKYKQIWVGNDIDRYGLDDEHYPGHTILLETTNNKYIFIGWKIFEFSLREGDELVKYVSYVGHNDFPYSWIVGKTHTYLLQKEVVIPSEYFDLTDDVYSQYYGTIKAPKGSVKKYATKLIRRIIED